MFRREVMQAAAVPEADAGFVQKDFFEFHLYTLGRTTTLPNNSTKQIELFDQARQIPAKKVLLYYGALQPYMHRHRPTRIATWASQMNKKVDVYLEFKNDKPSGSACRCPPAACACRSSTRPTAAWSSSARTRSITRRRMNRCA